MSKPITRRRLFGLVGAVAAIAAVQPAVGTSALTNELMPGTITGNDIAVNALTVDRIGQALPPFPESDYVVVSNGPTDITWKRLPPEQTLWGLPVEEVESLWPEVGERGVDSIRTTAARGKPVEMEVVIRADTSQLVADLERIKAEWERLSRGPAVAMPITVSVAGSDSRSG